MVHILLIRKDNTVQVKISVPSLIEHKSYIKWQYLKAESMCTTVIHDICVLNH